MKESPNPDNNQNQQNQAPNPFQSSLTQENAHQLPEINLPKGGGALQGIDEKMSVNPINGTAGRSIPLPVAPARGGFSPSLSINYSSGAGNGLFGMGWGLSIPSIVRKTNKELPQYQDAIASDTFVMAGAEDLVPMLKNSTGTWLPVQRQEGDYAIQQYRPRIEGSWVRIEKWTDQTNGESHWRTISGNNIITIYGNTPSSRIADPSDARKIFEWKIAYSYDNRGNILIYEYQKEDRVGVANSLHEKNRNLSNTTNTYLKRVHYGNRTHYKHGDALPGATDFLFETVFDYGDHSSSNFTTQPDQNWVARADAFSNFRAGFDVRTYRKCERVLLFHKFDAPADQPVSELLVSALEIGYENYADEQSTQPQLEGFSYLRRVQSRGYEYNLASQSYTTATQPPLEFYYQAHAWDTAVQELEDYTHLPVGINNGGYQWTDFYGEGISGFLSEQNQAWYYQENLGGGVFAPAKELATRPSLAGLGSRLQFTDLEGDGEKQLVNYTAAPQGFFEWKDGEQWQNFKYFETLPNRSFANDPYARFIDLDGDGRADVLITEGDLFQWHASKGKEGFGKANTIHLPLDEEEGPRVVFADSEQTIFLADMTGDGMTDIVRIENGSVCYWANKGYGHFSAKITMDHAPWIDHLDQFNPQYLYLMDIDGSGTTDIGYYHDNSLQIWCNLSGNAFVIAPQIIAPFPDMDSGTRLDIVDLLGEGSSCLVWSSGHAKDQNIPLRYINLTAGKKPHLLYKSVNNLGASSEVLYKTSTHYYLEDKKAGTPWATKLPFPVHVVAKTITTDHIQNTIFTQQYSYHHGYYDRVEREFRGFGKVVTLDTEALNTLLPTGATNIYLEHYQVPIKTISWYHTGAAIKDKTLSAAFRAEYYQNPAIEQPLKSTIIPTGLDDQGYLEAFRACKGLPLRQEVYSLDTDNPDHLHPYSTSQSSYEIRQVQPQEGQQYGVYQAIPIQSFAYAYDRNPADPRISQNLVLELDPELGIPIQTATIIYPRVNIASTLPWMVQAEQSKLHIVLKEMTLTSTSSANDAYHLKTAYEEKAYELLGKSWALGDAYFTPTGIQQDSLAATILDYIAEPTLPNTLYKRLHGHTKVQFQKDDLSTTLPIGNQEFLNIPYKTYQLAYTPAQLADLYTTAVGTNLLQNINLLNEGYVDLDNDGNLWLHSGTTLYAAGAANNFYIADGVEDILGNQSTLQLDAYQLLPIQTTDALGNTTQVAYDYRVLQPKLMTDLNGNQAAVAYDTLGIVVKSAVMGKTNPQTGQVEGDTLDHPTAQMDYDFFNYYNNKQPNYIHTQVREEHHSQNPVVTWQESYEYSNGMGGVLLTKVQTKDGEALQYQNGVLTTVDTSNLPTKRWIGNGRTIMNNKGMPIKQFEPYFSVTHEFEAAAELVEIGVSPVLFYDAAGRNYRTELPDGTFTKVEFDAWQSTSYDTNDTVLDSDWYQAALINNPLAAQEAAKQANTPTKVHLDSLGRTVYAENIAPNAVDNTAMYTQTDLAGRYSFIYDEIATAQLLAQPNNYTPARGFSSYSKTNLLGQAVYTQTAVKGDSYVLTDALGRMLRAWDNPDNTAQSLTLETDYDNLHRPLKTYVKKGSNQRICFAQTTYGESLANAAALNLRGQAYESYDQSGKMTTVALDFKGNPLEVTRQLTKVYDQTIDWNQNPVLEQDIFSTSSSYDALNRPTLTTLPNGTQLKPTYNSGGYLEQLEAQIMGQGGFMTFLDGQDYDAKGQKQWMKYGNNTITEYFYDAKTFRLERLLTTHPNHQPDQTKLNYNINKLQDLYYNYDTIGNLLQVEDKAQSTFYYNNQAISPLKRYEYDHLSRLLQATGREHSGATAPTHQDLVHLQNLPHQNIQNAVRQYTQTYKYDAVGNILKMNHQTGQGTGSWTRDYTYSQDAKNQLLQTTLSSTGTTANHNHYDIHGNMTRMPHLQALTWNFGDELVRVEHTGMTAYYNYDGGGQRVRKVVQKGTKREERLYLGWMNECILR